MKSNGDSKVTLGGLLGVLVLLGIPVVLFIALLLWGLPQYGVYSAEMDGRAVLARAESAKRAQIADAEAKYESAKYLRKAGVEIESTLTPSFLRYYQIQMMEEVGAKNDRAIYFMDGGANVVVPAPSPKVAPSIP